VFVSLSLSVGTRPALDLFDESARYPLHGLLSLFGVVSQIVESRSVYRDSHHSTKDGERVVLNPRVTVVDGADSTDRAGT
jgi:hypothetical protein